MPTRVRSYSKINLGLAVGPVRPDGFHGLVTCYQTLEAHDLITVSAQAAGATRITLTADHPGVPRSETGDAEKNTAFRMVALALERLGLSAEVLIQLQKRMPVQGGLGAGSANAAAALIALERELGEELSWPDRLGLAAEVGSDVPLFLLGGTTLGLNRGEEVYPLPDLPATPCVLAIPAVGVSTALAFRELDARMADQAYEKATQPHHAPASLSGRCHPEWSAAESKDPRILPRPMPGAASQTPRTLTQTPPVDKLKRLSQALSGVFAISGLNSESGLSGIGRAAADRAENPLLSLVRTGIENDFEEVAFSQHPSLRAIKRELVGSGSGQAVYAALSGSGSALFGLYATESDARAAQQRVQASGTRAVVTRTLPRSEYWHTMFAE